MIIYLIILLVVNKTLKHYLLPIILLLINNWILDIEVNIYIYNN